jgi:hypothetical protein
MLTLQLAGLIYVISSNFFYNSGSLSDLVATTLQFPLINATGLVALALSVSINRKKMLEIVETLSTTDKYLSPNKNVYYKKHNLRFTTLVIITVTYHIAVHSINTYFYPRGHINYYYAVSIYLCDFILSVNDLQYVNIVEVLTQHLILMNKKLHAIFVSQCHKNVSPKRSRPFSRKVEFCFSKIRGGFHNRDNFVILNSHRSIGVHTTVSGVTSGAAVQILKLRVCFNNLYHVCRLINSMYGLSLLMDFMTYTACLIGDFYNTCYILITPYKGHEPISVTRVTTEVLWVIASAWKVFSITFASYRANSEFKKTASEVQKLILRTRLKAGVQEQLDLFSIQLVNNKIEFTACGFFNVNFELVRTLVYTVTTYIILLIQVTWFN